MSDHTTEATSPYVLVEDWSDPSRHMTFPHPEDPARVEWSLRYGTPTREQALVAASYVAAYKQLVGDTARSRDRKVAGIRRASR